MAMMDWKLVRQKENKSLFLFRSKASRSLQAARSVGNS